MGLQPNIKKPRPFVLRQCQRCNQSYGPESYSKTRSLFYLDEYSPVCNDCIKEILQSEDFSWRIVNKVCQYLDIPFIPKEWEKLREMNGDDVFPIYVKVFSSEEFEDLGWQDYYEQFKILKDNEMIEDELPKLREAKYTALRKKWGMNYDEEDVVYLENLYEGVLASQTVNGSLQIDQALKLCKMSLTLESKMRDGEDFDKLLASYEKLVKIAEFTPKNTKNASDFDSVAELVKWLEKRGFVNKFYDGESRDIVDKTIENIQAWVQRLYINEPGVGEEIDRRIETLKAMSKMEQTNSVDYYDIDKIETDLDDYDYHALDSLDGDFDPEIE